jgi:hypothetical protein
MILTPFVKKKPQRTLNSLGPEIPFLRTLRNIQSQTNHGFAYAAAGAAGIEHG